VCTPEPAVEVVWAFISAVVGLVWARVAVAVEVEVRTEEAAAVVAPEVVVVLAMPATRMVVAGDLAMQMAVAEAAEAVDLGQQVGLWEAALAVVVAMVDAGYILKIIVHITSNKDYIIW
jgi:hypothetical protein